MRDSGTPAYWRAPPPWIRALCDLPDHRRRPRHRPAVRHRHSARARAPARCARPPPPCRPSGCLPLPLVEKLSSATAGSVLMSTRVLSAVAMAISASLHRRGLDHHGAIGEGHQAVVPVRAILQRHDEDARNQPRARVGPTACSAARTVSAVLLTAPPTLPSASPAPTIREAK